MDRHEKGAPLPLRRKRLSSSTHTGLKPTLSTQITFAASVTAPDLTLYKRLVWWSAAKGQSISGMAERTIAARIEANDAQIESMIADKAADLGLTPDEVKQRWLDDVGYRKGGA